MSHHTYERESRLFPVTCETVTDESAKQGDTAYRGYLDCCGHICDDRARSLSWSLRELVDAFGGYRPESDGGDVPRWLTVDARSDDLIRPSGAWAFADGSDVIGASVSIHRPDWITDDSWRRVCRLLGWRPWAEIWAQVGGSVRRADAALGAARAELAIA
jgi:hypothetical protein